jgi:hypothetical protein
MTDIWNQSWLMDIWTFIRAKEVWSLDVWTIIGAIAGVAAVIIALFPRASSQLAWPPSESQNLRAARRLRSFVQENWIAGVLANSLLSGPFITLSLIDQPDLALNGVSRKKSTNQGAPAPASLSNLIGPTTQSVLVLGEAGAGKTTLLLDLAEKLLSQRTVEIKDSIPVVLQLSPWRPRQPSRISKIMWRLGIGKAPIAQFGAWVASEIASHYRISEKVANYWVENDNLVLLLDGLDEVAAEVRIECVRSINEFFDKHMSPTFITSRREEYDALTTRLAVDIAVVIQPLSSEQVAAYLSDRKHDGLLLATLHADAALKKMAQSPLMLGVLSAANMDSAPLGSAEGKRRWVFKEYTRAMITRIGSDDPAIVRRAIRLVSRIAVIMQQSNATTFWTGNLRISNLQEGTEFRIFMTLLLLTFVATGVFLAEIEPIRRIVARAAALLSSSTNGIKLEVSGIILLCVALAVGSFSRLFVRSVKWPSSSTLTRAGFGVLVATFFGVLSLGFLMIQMAMMWSLHYLAWWQIVICGSIVLSIALIGGINGVAYTAFGACSVAMMALFLPQLMWVFGTAVLKTELPSAITWQENPFNSLLL